MKRLYLFILLNSMAAFGAIGETYVRNIDNNKERVLNIVRDKFPLLTGTDIFRLRYDTKYDKSLVKAVLSDLSHKVITELPHITNDTKVVSYSNGMIIYQAFAEQKPGKVEARYGAIDLCGNAVVPFRHKNVRDVLKSQEYQTYSMNEVCRNILKDAQNVVEFQRVKDKLDNYRKSRYTRDYELISDADWELGGYNNNRHRVYYTPIKMVVYKGKAAFTDKHDNFISDFQYKDTDFELSSVFCKLDNNGLKSIEFIKPTDYAGIQLYLLGLDKIVTLMVNINMSKWYNKDEFESLAEFAIRTTPEMNRKAQEYFASAAVRLYLALGMPRPFTLSDYDRENESFLIESPVGNVAMKIPFDKSMNFRNAWEREQIVFEAPRFSTIDDGVTLTSLKARIKDMDDSYLANTKTKYTRYIMGNATDVASPVIAVVKNPNPVEQKQVDITLDNGLKKFTPADVDLEIPQGNKRRDRAFALIIANENYDKLSDVTFARNDGEILAQYCTRTLGMPAQNVKTYFNATYGQMRQAISDMRKIAEAYGGDIDLLVYYAGHGAPDELTSKAYLLPADADGINPEYCIGRDYLLDEIAAMNTRNAVVMFDACFTGAERTEQKGKMLVAARSVEIEPQGPEFDDSKGNVRIINATSGRQTAIPDRENSHGLFTYYLLKKLRDSRGNVSMGDLWSYLDTNISQRSAVLGKIQRPSINAQGDWNSKPLLP